MYIHIYIVSDRCRRRRPISHQRVFQSVPSNNRRRPIKSCPLCAVLLVLLLNRRNTYCVTIISYGKRFNCARIRPEDREQPTQNVILYVVIYNIAKVPIYIYMIFVYRMYSHTAALYCYAGIIIIQSGGNNTRHQTRHQARPSVQLQLLQQQEKAAFANIYYCTCVIHDAHIILIYI